MSEDILKLTEITTFNAPLSQSQRGLVISNQLDRKVFDVRPIPPETLRMLTLFFDMIDIPRGPEDWIVRSDFMSRGKGRSVDEDYLIGEGFITRTTRIPKRQEGSAINVGRGEFFGSDILQHREGKEPGCWALSNIKGERPIFRPQLVKDSRGIFFELYDALPLPDRDTPLGDCLAFRSKYNDELLELRFHIDQICLKIGSTIDKNLAIASEVDHLRRASENYLSAMKGSGIRYVVNNLGLDFTLFGAAAGFTSLNLENGPYYFAAAAAAKVLNVAFKTTEASPYAYLWAAQKKI